MAINPAWLRDGAFIPINHETVALLIKELKNVPEYAKVSHFDEYTVHAKFNVAVPFKFEKNFWLTSSLDAVLNAALHDFFKENNGTYSQPRVSIVKEATQC